MRIDEIMTRNVAACRPSDTADVAAGLMWDRDCGCVPVVDGGRRVVGMVTDRDLCMAALTQRQPLAEIPVQSAMARRVITCRADEAPSDVEARMQAHQIRRLPVLDAEGRLAGIVSLSDLAHAWARGRGRRGVEPSVDDIAGTFDAITRPRAGAQAAPSS